MKKFIIGLKSWNNKISILYVKKYGKLFEKLPEGIFQSILEYF